MFLVGSFCIDFLLSLFVFVSGFSSYGVFLYSLFQLNGCDIDSQTE